MKVHLEKIGPNGYDLDEPLSVAWLTEALGRALPFYVTQVGHLTAHLTRVEETVVQVSGRVQVALEASCSRCLDVVHLPVTSDLSVTLFPKGEEPAASEDGEISADDMGVATYEHREIDLSSVVHDEVFLGLPMTPLCSNDCAGLCPRCGDNLNQGPCSCEPEVDMRLEALRHIKLS